MSKHAHGKGRVSSTKIRRLVLVSGIVAVLALGATAAVSLRATNARNSATSLGSSANSTPQPSSVQANATAARANLALRAGAPIPLDPQTGQVRPLTQEEAERLAAEIKQLVNQSSDGLQAVKHADGTVSMDLQGRFQSLAVRKRDENGEWVVACVNSPEAAAAFFEIDPALVGAKKNPAAPKTDAQPKGEVR